MPKTGRLFVFEGPDGVGKTTIALDIVNYLQLIGASSIYVSFPGHEVGTLGKLVYDLHHNPHNYGLKQIAPASLQLLHIAAHIDLIENIIKPTLQAGCDIVLDRYWWSTWVYGKVRGANPAVLTAMIDIELKSWGKIYPNAVFLIDRYIPFGENPLLSEWRKLKATYYKLATDQKRLYHINIIRNEGTKVETLNEIKNLINVPDQKHKSNDQMNHSNTEMQLNLNLSDRQNTSMKMQSLPVFSHLSPAHPTEVYNSYWRFAAERQDIFFRKLNGDPSPWTKDPILAKYKFTNVYRASDRVSQYLIRNVIYTGSQSIGEVFFRILLFKVFNRIETWELLKKELGEVTCLEYSFKKYDDILTTALSSGERIFSAAYIMPSGNKSFGHPKKHRNLLLLIEKMIEDEIPNRLSATKSMQKAFEILNSYPMIGDFLAYQYLIDINYSNLTNYSENEFVMPGPGARDGIRKCFKDLGGLNEVEIIKLMADRQEEEFTRLGLDFKTLWSRPLQLIDCQGLFCEIDKYARMAYPEIQSRRKRIKQIYKPKTTPIEYWFPPKWGINHLLNRQEKHIDTSL